MTLLKKILFFGSCLLKLAQHLVKKSKHTTLGLKIGFT